MNALTSALLVPSLGDRAHSHNITPQKLAQRQEVASGAMVLDALDIYGLERRSPIGSKVSMQSRPIGSE